MASTYARHVIKGRGKNSGKYLCWARMAPWEKPTEDGFVWLHEQSKAARWNDPQYMPWAWANERARIHNGYFVRLVCPAAVTAKVHALKTWIAERSAVATEKLDCYWIDSDFHCAADDLCRACAEKVVDQKYAEDPKRFESCEDAEERYRLAIDGGYDVEHDSPPYCESCGAKLSGTLTEYGADEEIRALTTNCIPGFADHNGWDALHDAIANLSDDDPRWSEIARIVEAVQATEAEKRVEERTPEPQRPMLIHNIALASKE